MTIYVLPTEPNMPPRAMLGEVATVGDGTVVLLSGVMATWSADLGTWTVNGAPSLPQELCDAITEHAKDLGVSW